MAASAALSASAGGWWLPRFQLLKVAVMAASAAQELVDPTQLVDELWVATLAPEVVATLALASLERGKSDKHWCLSQTGVDMSAHASHTPKDHAYKPTRDPNKGLRLTEMSEKQTTHHVSSS